MIPRRGDIVEIGRPCGAQFPVHPWPLVVEKVERTTYFRPEEMIYLVGWRVRWDLRTRVEYRPMLLVITDGLKLVRRSPRRNQLQSRLNGVG